MRKTLLIARREFAVTVGRLSFRIFMGIFPALVSMGIAALFVYNAVAGEEDEPPEEQTIGYIDLAGFVHAGYQQDNIVFKAFDDRPAATDALLADDIEALFVIPEDYLETGVVVEIRERQPGIPIDGAGNARLERFLLDNVLEGHLSDDRIERVRMPVLLTTLEVDETGEVVEERLDFLRIFFFLAVAGVIVFSVMTVTGYLLQGLNEEKESRIIEVLLSAMTPAQLMQGKLIGLGAAGLLQVLVWLAAGAALFIVLRTGDFGFEMPPLTIPPPPLVLLAIVYFLLAYAFFGAILGGLGAVTTSSREAGQITFLFVLPAFVPIWALTPLLSTPDGVLARVLTYIPFTGPTTALIRVAVNGIGPLEIVLSLAVLGGATALTIVIVQRLFRAYLLALGQRPGLRQVARTLLRG